MTKDEVAAQLAALIEELTSVPSARVIAGARLIEDLDLDSAAITEIAVAVEDRLGVHIPDSQLGQFKTVADLVEYIAMRNPVAVGT